MRFFLRLLAVMVLLSVGALSVEAAKDIVTGAFSTPDRAQLRNTKLETYLRQDADIAMLLQEHRFSFDVKFARGHYRSVLTHFSSEDDIPAVLQSVRQVLPDAYVTATGNAGQTTSKAAETAAETAPSGTPKSAAAVTAGSGDEDIVVIDETGQEATDSDRSETASDNSSNTEGEVADNTSVIPEAGTEIPAETAQTPAPAPSEPPYLMYGIIGAVAVLAVLLFIAMRKPAETKPPKPEERALRVPEIPEAPEEEAPAEEAAAEAAAPEAAELPEAEAPLPAAEEAPVTETTPAEAVVEMHPEMPEAAPVTRKKRDLPAHPKTATKDDLAEFAGSRILVAEDNLINQKVITKLLEGSGIDIVIADNGQIAVDTLASDPGFDMILMDAHMPVKDGFEASREIRADSRFDPIVIVALSGDVSSDDIRNMREAGMEEQLAKPLRVEALYNVMYQYLDFASAEEEPQPEAEEEGLPEIKTHDDEMTLNSTTGLDICAGDKAMYAEILDEFVSTYGTSDTLIDAYIQAKNDVKLVQLSLDIKGVAANIGAERLSEAAETLREAVLVNQTESYPMLAQEFKTELHQLLAAIDAFKSTL